MRMNANIARCIVLENDLDGVPNLRADEGPEDAEMRPPSELGFKVLKSASVYSRKRALR